MNSVDKKVKELLNKGYRMDYWDCYNDSPNTDEWMLEQQIENSLIVVEEILNIDIVINDEDTYYFYDAVKEKLIKMKENVDKNRR